MMVTTTNKKRNTMTTNPIDDLFKNLKPLLAEADKITSFAKDIFGDLASASESFGEGETGDGEWESDEPKANYKAVFNLGLSDALVLDDGSWQVVGIEEDAFDADIVHVYLDNGESYNLLRTSLVRVV